MMRRPSTIVPVLALLALSACDRGPEPRRGDGTRFSGPDGYTMQTLQQALPSLWDDGTYFSVELRTLRPQFRWQERAITVEVEGRRPLLDVREEEYAVDPAALQPKPEVVAPPEGSTFWGVRMVCRQPACMQVDGRAGDGAVSERRDANYWLTRDEASARALAATLEAVLGTPAS